MQVIEFIRTVRTQLFDPGTGAGWTDREIVDYLNFAQRRICFVKPDTYVQQRVVALVLGTTQTLPDDGIALLDVVGNGTTGATVTQVNEELLKSANRFWRGATFDTTIENYAADPRNPRRYLVSPPAAIGTPLEIVYGAVPADLSVSNQTVTLPLPTSFDPILMDGVLAQAYAKPGRRQNPDKAAAHLSMFNNAIGIKDKMQMIVAPKVGQ